MWSGLIALWFNVNIFIVYLDSLRFDTSDAAQWVAFIVLFAPFAVLLIMVVQRIRLWFSVH